MINKLKSIGLFALLLLIAASCTQEARQSLTPTPTAYGPRNQLVVVMDEELWKSDIGDTVRFYYGSAYPVLPQPEPIFDITHFTPQEMAEEPLRQQLRHFVFVADISDADSPTKRWIEDDLGSEKLRSAREVPNESTTVLKDRWAKNQLLIYLYANGEETLKEQLIKTFPAAKKRLDQSNKKKIKDNVYVAGENRVIISQMQESMGMSMQVPKPFLVAYDKDNIMWLRRETPVSSSNIMIYKEPYKDTEQITREHLKDIQNSLGKKLVSTDIDGTYMRINDIDLPMFTETKQLNGNYALEARGVWDIVNDFAGGPFVSYLVINPKTNELVHINGFIHAPGEEKREFMQNLEHIIGTVSF